MASPAQQLPSRSPQIPSTPQLLQPSVQPQASYTQDSANPCQLPKQEQPFPTAWAPMAGVAPPAPTAGLQMALHGCLFDPRIFSIRWMNTNLPSPATSMLGYSTACLPTAALWAPQGCETLLVGAAPGTLYQGQPQLLQGRVSTPAPQVLPTGFAEHQDTERQFAQLSVSNVATPKGVHPGSNTHSHCAAPHIQAIGHPPSNLPLSEEMLLDCQDGAISIPMPGEPGSPSRAISHPDISSLSLPTELLTPDYSTPETTSTVLSLEHLNIIRMGPEEQWWEVGTDLPDF